MGQSSGPKPDYNTTWSNYSNTKLEKESTWSRRISYKRAQMGQAGLTPDSPRWQEAITGLEGERDTDLDELATGDMAETMQKGYGIYTRNYESGIENSIQESSGLSGPAWQDYKSANPDWNKTDAQIESDSKRINITPGANRDAFEADTKPLTGKAAWEQSGPSIRNIKSRDEITADIGPMSETWQDWAEGTLSSPTPEEKTDEELTEEGVAEVRDEAGSGGSGQASNPWT